MENFIFRSKSQGRSGMKRSRRMEPLWNRSSRPNLTAYYPERRLKIPSNARNRSVRNPRRLCACGARSSRQGVAKEKKTAEEERIRGGGGKSAVALRRRIEGIALFPSLYLPLSLPLSPSMPWTGLLGIPFSSRGIIGRQLATLLRVSRRQEIIL